MTLLTLTIPDDPAELTGWLERRLVSPDFGQFVAELAAHFPDVRGTPDFKKAFDKWAPVAVERGLSAVPADVLGQFLRHPAVLVSLQELVLTDGGAHWDEVADSSEDLTASFSQGKSALDSLIEAEAVTVPSEVAKRSTGRVYKIWATVSTAVAVCLAAVVGYQAMQNPPESPVPKAQVAWGWGKPSGLAADQTTPKGYLNKLADNVEEWSLHQPVDATGVSVRLAEFRTGCSRLMHSPYGPLAEADKAWLLDNCRKWAKQLDSHQQALDGGANPAAVRADVDELVKSISSTLRIRSKDAG